ncbi:hypothetical protein M758_5G130700 [Ceratodon purpureus]|nr:hypothetical protein M758_5G130700 [Ceratodon purpureus]
MRVFPNKGGSGLRIVPNDQLSEEECAKVYNLYVVVYNHPPPNKEYARYFLRSWLAEREGKAKINWARFAFDICRKQYASWERDGRVEEACRMKWDELQGLQTAGEGTSGGQRRQFGAACDAVRFSREQTSEVLELLKVAEADNNAIAPKM